MICPVCSVRPSTPEHRPFCSERCRLIDLSRWIDGTYRIPSESAPADDENFDEEKDR